MGFICWLLGLINEECVASGPFSILFLPGSDEDLVLPSSTLRVISLNSERSIKLIKKPNTNWVQGEVWLTMDCNL